MQHPMLCCLIAPHVELLRRNLRLCNIEQVFHVRQPDFLAIVPPTLAGRTQRAHRSTSSEHHRAPSVDGLLNLAAGRRRRGARPGTAGHACPHSTPSFRSRCRLSAERAELVDRHRLCPCGGMRMRCESFSGCIYLRVRASGLVIQRSSSFVIPMMPDRRIVVLDLLTPANFLLTLLQAPPSRSGYRAPHSDKPPLCARRGSWPGRCGGVSQPWDHPPRHSARCAGVRQLRLADSDRASRV
jgi:hypothetical protein